jgi:hypothetical protein
MRSVRGSEISIMKSWNLFLVATFAVACSESVESTDIRTSGIYPEIVVTATGNGSSVVEVQLKVGGASSNTFLDLKGEDTLEATAGGVTKTLDETSSETYRASFAVDAEGTEFEVAFLRGDADENAPSSTVTLPAPFELAVEVTEASRTMDDFNFTWEPPGSGSVSWDVSGDCIISEDDDTPDDGAATIPAGTMESFESEAQDSCTVNLALVRSDSGSIDPAFTEGGSIVAQQVRGETFTTTP